jgi:exopolysaccharide production protein ExoQ
MRPGSIVQNAPTFPLLGQTAPAPRTSRVPTAPDHVYWLFEHLVAVFGLLLCSGALMLLYTPPGADRAAPLDQANHLFQIASGSLYLLAGAMLLPLWREARLLLARNKALVLLLAVAVASFLWAVEPAVALRRAMTLLLTFGFALWLAIRFAPVTLLRLTAVALLLGALASTVAAVMGPEIGKHVWDNHAGLWRGVFGHKNTMGRMMSLATVAGLLLVTTSPGSRLTGITVFGLAAFLVVMSGSATAGATMLLVLLILPACSWLFLSRLPPRVVVPVALGAGLALALAMMALAEPILSLLGRDPTLSGRTRLWELAVDEGLRRPLLGAGFRTFWLEEGPGGGVMALVSWGEGNIGNGHNGFLDLWLELGLTGVVAYGIVLKEAAARIANLISQNDRLAVWLAVVLVHLSAYAMTERVLLEHTDLSWLLFMVLLLQATPALAPARQGEVASGEEG